MREYTFLFFIFSHFLVAIDSTEPQTEKNSPDSRVEHLKDYCGVKSWTKKMPDWLMFRTGPGLIHDVFVFYSKILAASFGKFSERISYIVACVD